MRPAKLTCPNARYNARMFINCEKTHEPCAHQRWCEMTGWAKLTNGAAMCKVAQEAEVTTDERKAKTAKKRRNKV